MTAMPPISGLDRSSGPGSAFSAGVAAGELSGPADDGMVPVRLKSGETVLAETMVDLDQAGSVGSRCLIARDDDGKAYLLGLLGPPRPGIGRLASSDGSAAVRVRAGGAERLEIRDRDGNVVVSYDPSRNLTRILSVPGDLELAAPAGTVRISGGHGVEMSGPTLRLRGDDALLEARRARMVTRDVALSGERVRLTARRLDVAVEVSIHKARDFYRTVVGLFQSRSGRTRLLIDRSYEVDAERAYLRTKEEVRILGRKIHLG